VTKHGKLPEKAYVGTEQIHFGRKTDEI